MVKFDKVKCLTFRQPTVESYHGVRSWEMVIITECVTNKHLLLNHYGHPDKTD